MSVAMFLLFLLSDIYNVFLVVAYFVALFAPWLGITQPDILRYREPIFVAVGSLAVARIIFTMGIRKEFNSLIYYLKCRNEAKMNKEFNDCVKNFQYSVLSKNTGQLKIKGFRLICDESKPKDEVQLCTGDAKVIRLKNFESD